VFKLGDWNTQLFGFEGLAFIFRWSILESSIGTKDNGVYKGLEVWIKFNVRWVTVLAIRNILRNSN